MNKNRPLEVKFDFKSTAFDLLAKAKKLKDIEEYGQVFIVPDRGREKRIKHRKVVEQSKIQRKCVIFGTKPFMKSFNRKIVFNEEIDNRKDIDIEFRLSEKL